MNNAVHRERFSRFFSLVTLFFVMIPCLYGCSEHDSTKENSKKISYLFPAEHCRPFDISKDQREILSPQSKYLSFWQTVQTGDHLFFSYAMTTREEVRKQSEKRGEITQSSGEVVGMKRKTDNLLTFKPAEKITFDKTVCTLWIYTEDRRGNITTLFEHEIAPTQGEIESHWLDKKISLSDFEADDIRLHFETMYSAGVHQNQLIVTNPVLIRSAEDRTPSFFIISLDTLRADHLGCYGYPRSISPNLDRFSKENTLYERVIAPSSWTLPSHMSLFTGLPVYGHNVYLRRSGELSRDIPTMTEIFRENDYYTAAFTEGGYLSPGWGLERGFHRYVYSGLIDENVKKCFHWLAHHGPDIPFFYFFHTYEIHLPYNKRHPRKIFAENQLEKPYIVTKRKLSKNYSTIDLKKIINSYDEGIRYADEMMGLIFRKLKENKQYGLTEIIVFSDHGEEFLEHGKLFHGENLYTETVHVPLLWKNRDMNDHIVQEHLNLTGLRDKILNTPGIVLPAEPLPRTDTIDVSEIKGNERKMRIDDGENVIITQFEETHSPSVQQYNVMADPQEKSPIRSDLRDYKKTAQQWAKMYKTPQLWIAQSEGETFSLEIVFDEALEPKILFDSTAGRINFNEKKLQLSSSILQEKVQHKMESSRRDGAIQDGLVFGISLQNTQGTITIKKVGKSTDIPLSHCSEDSFREVLITDSYTISLPIPAQLTFADFLHRITVIQQSGITVFVPPVPSNSELETSLSDETIEELRALGYVE